jgi:diguanylate cyclase (GGDEF)-like protein
MPDRANGFSIEDIDRVVINVVIIDDEKDFTWGLELIVPLLLDGKGVNHKVFPANNAGDAMKVIGGLDGPAIVLLDMTLRSPKDGLDLLIKIKGATLHPVAPFFLTGDVRGETRDEAAVAGAYGYLGKPLNNPDLQRMLMHGVTILRDNLRILQRIKIAKENEEHAKQVAIEAQHAAMHDKLTGILNRGGFDKRAMEILANSRIHRTSTSLILVDVDDFKNINDEHPWLKLGGDEVLRQVALVLKGAFKRDATDVVARWGGDEFAILLENTNDRSAKRRSVFTRRKIKGLQVSYGGHLIPVSASAGIGSLSPAETTVNSEEDLKILIDRASVNLALEKGRSKAKRKLVKDG